MGGLTDAISGALPGLVTGDWTGAAVGALGGLSAGSSNATAAGYDQTPKFNATVQPHIENNLESTAQNQEYQVYGGPRVAGFNDNQNAGISMAGALSNTMQGQQTNVDSGFNNFASGNYLSDGNPYLASMVSALQDSAQNNFTRNINPAIVNNAVVDGAVGGSRQGIAQGLAMSDLNQQLVNAESQLRGNAYQNDMSNMLSALTNQGSILSGQTAPQQQLLQTGALQQGQEQATLDSNREVFDEQTNAQYQRDQEMLSLLLGTPSSQAQMPAQTNPLAAGLGATMTYQQLFGNTNATPTTPAATPTPTINPYTQGNGLTTANSLL